MKVLHIGLACAHGGAESLMATLIREQRKIGIEADIFFVADLGASAQFRDICRVMFADRDFLADVLLRERYDVIHMANHAPWAVRAIKAVRYDGAIVTTYHIWGRFFRNLPEDVVVGISKAVAESVQPEYSQQVRVIYNGTDTDLFKPGEAEPADRPVIAWVGRSNDYAKDIGGMVAIAMSPVARDFQIVIVDGSPEGQEFCSYWLPENASVVARKPWTQMPDFYRWVAASRGFLLSTARAEPFGLNFTEAQACGCPAVALSGGGVPEVIEHKSTGYVYEPGGGVPAVAEAVEWLYSGDNYEQASKRGIQRVRELFSAERMCREYAAVYEDAVKAHKRRFSKRMFQIMLRPSIPLVKSLAFAYQRSRR